MVAKAEHAVAQAATTADFAEQEAAIEAVEMVVKVASMVVAASVGLVEVAVPEVPPRARRQMLMAVASASLPCAPSLKYEPAPATQQAPMHMQ